MAQQGAEGGPRSPGKVTLWHHLRPHLKQKPCESPQNKWEGSPVGRPRSRAHSPPTSGDGPLPLLGQQQPGPWAEGSGRVQTPGRPTPTTRSANASWSLVTRPGPQSLVHFPVFSVPWRSDRPQKEGPEKGQAGEREETVSSFQYFHTQFVL